jgi:hypothetical protein
MEPDHSAANLDLPICLLTHTRRARGYAGRFAARAAGESQCARVHPRRFSMAIRTEGERKIPTDGNKGNEVI